MSFFDSILPKNTSNIVNPEANPVSSLFGAGIKNTLLKDAIRQVQSLAAAANPPPSLITPTQMATDADKKVAQRKLIADQLSRKGRDSTILTDTLGEVG